MENKYYVSYEAARLLKEKGYNEVTNAAWNGFFGDIRISPQIGGYRNSDYPDDIKIYSAATKSEAIDWLEQVHGIHIEIRMKYCKIEGEAMEIKDTDEYAWRWFYAICIGDDVDNPILEEESEGSEYVKLFNSRLEAENAAIIRALKEITKL